MLDKLRITDPKTMGHTIGPAAHSVSAERGIEHGAIEGAMSGMAMMGIVTAMAVPFVEQLSVLIAEL